MNRKIICIIISFIVILNNVSYIHGISIKENDNMAIEKNKVQECIYLIEGEGSTTIGDGSINNPYRNIRTALSKIKDNQTLKIIGSVVYTKYEVHTDKSALPLYIDKNITIEGASLKSPLDDDGDKLILRAPIQLKANVTFKNLNLQLVPEIKLGGNLSGRLMGEIEPKSATIFVSGYNLTLDNISTKVGTSQIQDLDRPYISGGIFKNTGEIGPKSIINIINPNSETKFSKIYAGDLWSERQLDVEINLNGKVLDNTIYAGGETCLLKGNIDISLGNKSNVSYIDKTNHSGKINLKLEKDTYNDRLNTEGINDLLLEENSKLILSKESNFDIDNLTLNKDAVIDFRKLEKNPIINNNFEGTKTLDSGTILLTNKQTLNVCNQVVGNTKLNYRDTIYNEALSEDHEYVRARLNSSGNFYIDPNINNSIRLAKNLNNNNYTTWAVVYDKNTFKDFVWKNENNNIVNSSSGDEHKFKIEFINDKENKYIPYGSEWDEFEFTLKKIDGTILDEDSACDDEDLFFTIDYLSGEIILNVHNTSYLGEITLIAKHKITDKTIYKKVNIVKQDNVLKGNVYIKGNCVDNQKIEADISNLSITNKNIKYNWYVDNVKVDNYSHKEFILKKEHVGKKIKVEVEVENYIGTIFSDEVFIKTLIKPTIKGIRNISINLNQKINLLDNITATDALGKSLTNKIEVYGHVDISKPNIYKIEYKVEDDYGNIEKVTREVIVKLKAMKNIKAICNNYESIKLTWNKDENASGYEIYISNTKNFKEKPNYVINRKDITSYVNTKLDTNKTYYYKIRAYKKVNNRVIYGDFSPIISSTPKMSSTTVKSVSSSYDTNKISWNKVSGANGYEVFISTSKNGKGTLKEVNKTTYTHTKLETNKAYYYKVRPYRIVNKKKVYGTYSNIISLTPKISKPSITLSTSIKSVTVKWKKVAGADGYEIYRSTSKNGKYSKIPVLISGNKTSYINNKLTSKKTYYYKIRAYRKINKKKIVYSPYSEIKSIKVK